MREIAGLSNERAKDAMSFYENALDNEEKLNKIIEALLTNIDDFVKKMKIIESQTPIELKDDLLSFVTIQQNGVSELTNIYQSIIDFRNELNEKIELINTETNDYISQLD